MDRLNSFELSIAIVELVTHTDPRSILETCLAKDYKLGFAFVAFHSFS